MECMADWLERHAAATPERVALLNGNSAEGVDALFACAQLGGATTVLSVCLLAAAAVAVLVGSGSSYRPAGETRWCLAGTQELQVAGAHVCVDGWLDTGERARRGTGDTLHLLPRQP